MSQSGSPKPKYTHRNPSSGAHVLSVIPCLIVISSQNWHEAPIKVNQPHRSLDVIYDPKSDVEIEKEQDVETNHGIALSERTECVFFTFGIFEIPGGEDAGQRHDEDEEPVEG